jgi:hypothetical protein
MYVYFSEAFIGNNHWDKYVYLPNFSQIVLEICAKVQLDLGVNRPLFLSDFTQDPKCFDKAAKNSEV